MHIHPCRFITPFSRTALYLTLALLFVLPAGSLRADAGVKDDGKFFKTDTVDKANADLKQAHTDFGKELVIETFPAVPEYLKSEYEAAKDDAAKRSEFFSTWLGNRAHSLEVNGVYVLICKDPAHLEVKAGAKTKARAFTQANQDKLRDILVESFKTQSYDEGLEKGVAYFRSALKDNMGGVKHTGASVAPEEQFHHNSGNASSGGHFQNQGGSTSVNPPIIGRSTTTHNGSSYMWIIIVVIGAIIVVRILSNLGSRSGGGGYGSGPGPGYGGGNVGGNYGGGYQGGGGGGGFFRNMLGGMVGGAAGGYMYDKFRDRNNPNQSNTGGMNTPDTSSGGDFGTSSSSSDDNDRGQGFGGGGSSGDFGSSSSGSSDSGSSSSDSGSSGGDSGGGGGSGGDF
jgi:uncharacterized membrane protein YeaQ/YmgE (transglycosylase-associated protein family)